MYGYWAPTLLVMTMTVLRKSTFRPLLSVSRPSSSICRRILYVGVRLLDFVSRTTE